MQVPCNRTIYGKHVSIWSITPDTNFLGEKPFLVSNEESVSMWWRPHVSPKYPGTQKSSTRAIRGFLLQKLKSDQAVVFMFVSHDDVIKWKHSPRYWPFVRGIHRSPVNSPHKGQWNGNVIFFFDLRLNKRLSKQSRRWWFETPSR